ncbi:6,7-dimethyl-8-ribityllumazine synthase [Humitalea sp. 24SJ18S-53]|uniref:6,7-dimethyl-8-ribityllumazine synthase n=1 Tax=Humitalea sp. 24SJ18S-53 TaxID=3422307 RepID=UPI003D67D80B
MSTADAPEPTATILPGAPLRLLAIIAPYYKDVVTGMLDGARGLLAGQPGAAMDVVEVAGAFELPAAFRMALRAGSAYDGVLMLGCVVKGETDHYDFICQAVCDGAMSVAADTGAALGFGLLTVASIDQAEARSAPDRHNKGAEAMAALLGQVGLRRRWDLS